MTKNCLSLTFTVMLAIFIFSNCSENKTAEPADVKSAATNDKPQYAGYESQVKWGEHLVLATGCADCHMPKKFGPNGMEDDTSLSLSGHPSKMPYPDVNRKELETKHLMSTGTLTSWIGPWGISFSANITSDSTGIGSWKEEQFIKCIREGKSKGLDGARPLLPPMPWFRYKNMTDDELKAIFSYLKSTKPIKNIVPAPVPPMLVAISTK